MLALMRACSRELFCCRTDCAVAAGVVAVLKLNMRCPIWTAHSTVWAGVAQLVEHLICNQRVGGSNPSVSSKSASSARPTGSVPFGRGASGR